MRILFVDPHADSCQSWALLLRHQGHQVCIAGDGLSALEQSTPFQPQAVITELAVPGLDGCQLARRLREQQTPPPLLVALTWCGQRGDRDRAQEAGFDFFLVKPADPRLVQAILYLRDTQSYEEKKGGSWRRMTLEGPACAAVFSCVSRSFLPG